MLSQDKMEKDPQCRSFTSHCAPESRKPTGAGDLRQPLPRDALNVVEDDQFMTIMEHLAADFRYGSGYGVARSADVVYIQITVFNTRTVEQKKALFRRMAELLGKSPGIRPGDVLVLVLEAAKENWSVGHGLAQFA
jgi:4-oxalocrotonate tautomerase